MDCLTFFRYICEHNVFCRRPQGTGFLKFTTTDAADAALAAANTVASPGILIKGRPVKVLKALDKKTAQDKALEKAKKEDTDHRNVYLAKVALQILLVFYQSHTYF